MQRRCSYRGRGGADASKLMHFVGVGSAWRRLEMEQASGGAGPRREWQPSEKAGLRRKEKEANCRRVVQAREEPGSAAPARSAARSVAPPPGSASKPPLPGCRSRASSRCSWDPRRQALTHQSRRYRDAGALRTRCSAPPLLGI